MQTNDFVKIHSSQKNRISDCVENKKYYNNQQPVERVAATSTMFDVEVNLFTKLVNARANTCYCGRYSRKYNIEELDLIYKQNVSIFSAVSLLHELHGNVAVRVLENEGQIHLLPYAGSDFSVITNPLTNQVEVLIIAKHLDASNYKYQIWAANKIIEFSSNGRENTTSNPYGFIPFAFLNYGYSDDFYSPAPATSIRKVQKIYNSTLTEIFRLLNYNGGSVLVSKGFENAQGLILDPATGINLQEGQELNAVNLQVNIADYEYFLKNVLDSLYATAQVPKIAIQGSESGSYERSGQAISTEWLPIKQVFFQKAQYLKSFEIDLAAKINKVLNYTNNTNNELEYFSINFDEASIIPVDLPTSEIENKFKLGLDSPYEQMIRLDPDMSLDIPTDPEALLTWRLNQYKQIIETQDNVGKLGF